MARLGPVDLETLDALITAGIAASRCVDRHGDDFAAVGVAAWSFLRRS